jgi:hypothetical protein
LVFKKNTIFFAENWENCDHNIGPWEVNVMITIFGELSAKKMAPFLTTNATIIFTVLTVGSLAKNIPIYFFFFLKMTTIYPGVIAQPITPAKTIPLDHASNHDFEPWVECYDCRNSFAEKLGPGNAAFVVTSLICK